MCSRWILDQQLPEVVFMMLAGEGSSTIDPDQVVEEIRSVMAGIIEQSEAHGVKDKITGIALDSFASSLILVDAAGNALTPCYTYADAQSAKYVEQLRTEISEDEYHARTGVRLHPSYHPALM